MSDSQEKKSEQGYEPQYEKSGVSAGFWLLVGIVLLSIALGFLAHYKLRGSADVVSKAQKTFGVKGKSLTLQQCVKETLKWNSQCAGLKILCQASIPRVVGACLEAQKRAKVCNAFDMGKSSSHFSYRECKPFGFKKRHHQKSCVLAYNTVYSYCFHLRGGRRSKATVKKTAGKTKVRSATPKAGLPTKGKAPSVVRTVKKPTKRIP